VDEPDQLRLTVAESTPSWIPVTYLAPSTTFWAFTAGGSLDGKLSGDTKYTLVAQAIDLTGIAQSVFVLNTSSFTILKDNVNPNTPYSPSPRHSHISRRRWAYRNGTTLRGGPPATPGATLRESKGGSKAVLYLE